MDDRLERTIEDAFERRAEIDAHTVGPVREAVELALDGLDRGQFRVALVLVQAIQNAVYQGRRHALDRQPTPDRPARGAASAQGAAG